MNVEIVVEEKYVWSIIKYLDKVPSKFVLMWPFIQQTSMVHFIIRRNMSTTQQSKLVLNYLSVIFQQWVSTSAYCSAKYIQIPVLTFYIWQPC